MEEVKNKTSYGMKSYFLVFGVFATFALLLAGSYEFLQVRYINDLEQKASEAFNKGDYLASLNSYTSLRENDVSKDLDVEAKIIESKNLLVAEEVLLQARNAKDDGDWFAVKALLEEGDATTNVSFKYYEEAIALYVESANKVRDLEEKIERELAAFRQEAAQEKARRENAEYKAEIAKVETAQIKQELETTIREKEQTTAELEAATFAKNAAEQVAIQERFLKFLNEFELYAKMLTRASVFLDDALSEIERGKNTSSLILLNQGKVLFDEVKTRAGDMLDVRTDEQYKGEVRMLLQATTLFIEASRSFGGAVFYIDKETEEDGARFTSLINDGKAANNEALRLLGLVEGFIASSR